MYLSQDANELEHRGSSPDSSHSLKVSSLVPGSKSLVSEETILITFLFLSLYIFFIFVVLGPWEQESRVRTDYTYYFFIFYLCILFLFLILVVLVARVSCQKRPSIEGKRPSTKAKETYYYPFAIYTKASTK